MGQLFFPSIQALGFGLERFDAGFQFVVEVVKVVEFALDICGDCGGIRRRHFRVRFLTIWNRCGCGVKKGFREGVDEVGKVVEGPRATWLRRLQDCDEGITS